MSKRPKKLKFMGEAFTPWQHRELISLIEMTAGRMKIHKKDFTTERMFWDVIHAFTGFRRSERETIHEAVLRIALAVRSNGLAWRDIRIAALDPNSIRAMFKADSQHGHLIKTFVDKSISSFISKELKDEFYKSWEWRKLRMGAIQRHGRSCQCCGAAPGQKYASGEPVRICVDHIKPISKHWHLRLDLSNLQILCDECNMGKGNWSETDFRPSAPIDPLEGLDPSILDQLTDRTTGRLQ